MMNNTSLLRTTLRPLCVTVFVLGILAQCLGQCADALLPVVIKKLDDYNYVKEFKVELKPAKKGSPPAFVEHSVILNARQVYRIYVQNPQGSTGKIIAVLHNQGNAIASTFEIIDVPMYFDYVEFECQKTDIYTLRFSFESGSGCGLGVLAVAAPGK